MILEVTKRHITGSTDEYNPFVAAFFEETHIETRFSKTLEGYALIEKNGDRFWAVVGNIEWNDELYDADWCYIGNEMEPVTIELKTYVFLKE